MTVQHILRKIARTLPKHRKAFMLYTAGADRSDKWAAEDLDFLAGKLDTLWERLRVTGYRMNLSN